MRRTEQAQASRAALLRSARHRFATRGYEGTTVSAILAGAGMARGALYHYFPGGKADVFRAVFEQVNDEFHARRDTLRALESPFERIRAGVHLFLQLSTEPDFARIALVDAPRLIESQAELGSSYELLREQLEDAVAGGEIRAGADADALARVLYGAVRSAGQFVMDSEDPSRALAAARASLDLVLDGIRETRRGAPSRSPRAGRSAG